MGFKCVSTIILKLGIKIYDVQEIVKGSGGKKRLYMTGHFLILLLGISFFSPSTWLYLKIVFKKSQTLVFKKGE